jgi:hypothetical protein
MFDSPFEFCRVCREFVLLDQTQRQCAREHACADAAACPFRRYFTGHAFAGEPAPAAPPSPRATRRPRRRA